MASLSRTDHRLQWGNQEDEGQNPKPVSFPRKKLSYDTKNASSMYAEKREKKYSLFKILLYGLSKTP